ncbi:MAG: DEAD/DEAH box helicase [Chlamydiia bacterium]|nr:DEAD/DEAH box helicase [Chlamydiia bacterium]
MPALPKFLQPYKAEGEVLIAQGLVGDVEFSGETYQVQLFSPDRKSDVWAFLQLDHKGRIKDCFCSCEDSGDTTYCSHLSAAFLRIYNGHSSPLHHRYERSFWNAICHLMAEKIGFDIDNLYLEGDAYVCESSDGQRWMRIHGTDDVGSSRLQEMLQYRQEETEETSLKFSNLTQEEIALWRKGKPTPQLRYELSFWSDLAKLLMLQQDEHEGYEFIFEEDDEGIPCGVKAIFPQMTAEFHFTREDLVKLLPSLSTVNTPLAVHDAGEDAVKKITYDCERGEMYIAQGGVAHESEHEQGISLDGWSYIPEKGFFPKDNRYLLGAERLQGQDIDRALQEHFHLIRQHLVGTKVHPDPVPLSYYISFDSSWNLHLEGYLFNPGDLYSGHSRCFGEWAYLDGEGFYHLEGMRFPDLQTTIAAEDVPEFVTAQRIWLSTQPGFETHIASVEAQMSYLVRDDGNLLFERVLAVDDSSAGTKDFGQWVYIQGRGFYCKVTSELGLPVRPGIAISPEQVPLFIRMNRDELQLIPGFFSDNCPVKGSKLEIRLLDEETIEVTPQYELHERYSNKPVRFYEDFAFVEGEGFSEIPLERRLPEDYHDHVEIRGEKLSLFLKFELNKLKRYAIDLDPRLILPKKIELEAERIALAPARGKGWYALNMGYRTENALVDVADIWTALQHKRRFLFCDAGLIDLSEQRFNWIRPLVKDRLDMRGKTLFLTTLELIKLNAVEEVHLRKSRRTDYGESVALLQELLEFKTAKEPDLSLLHSHLRPYQEIGLRWLWFLYQHQLSGLLCDDMGLGKTHQSMGLIAAIHKENPGKYLVVCPTSVIYHWQEKLEKFLPGLRVCTFYGPSRMLDAEYDILLTSYGIWRNEAKLLRQVAFEVAIFDEIQVAKNQSSMVHSALLNVKAQIRLGLTGTPIENRLRELKALFDIVLPGYMPAEQAYRDFFVRPIERDRDPSRSDLLNRYIKPFVLRRRKEDVLLDLPRKTEEVSHCDLEPDQRQLYHEVLCQSRQQLVSQLNDDGSPVPFIHIFALLSHLKQICNHPAVYLKDPNNYKEYQSGKWELFLELLSEARDSGQKVVVFSQYLHMLDIIENYLQEQQIDYATIRGATINRGEQIRRFNKDPQCEVFVGSLQASGLGVDLTAGSVVIHYDRWWNAARENQATDRVHRIGQTRGVQVFKLVTKNTFEEKIDQIITRKGRLMEEVVGVDDHQVIKQFDRTDLIELLQDIY